MANWSAAVLHNGLGLRGGAGRGEGPAVEETYSPLSTQLVLPVLVGARRENRTADLAESRHWTVSAMTVIEGSDWAKGLEARSASAG